jgi:hypothetical protein
MVDQSITKLVRLIIKDIKIQIHGILYIITFMVMKKKNLDSTYSMLLNWPWLHNALIIHDWGNNGNQTFG